MSLNSIFHHPLARTLLIGCIAFTSGNVIAKDGAITGPKVGVADKYRLISADMVQGGIASVQAAAHIGPKGGDTRKGIYAVARTRAGAAFPTVNPQGWFIGPKGGDVRKGIY